MNQVGFPLLSLVTWLPLVGCVVILSVRGDEETVASNARWTALRPIVLVCAV
jgi:NADH-quinone oxidoreductase subunit M